MKQSAKLILGIFIFLIFLSCNKTDEKPAIPVSVIPNGDFENWETLFDLDKPVGWGTSNFSLYGVVTFNTVSKDGIDKHSGNFSTRLETASQIVNDQEVKIVGLITLGNFDVDISTKKAKISGGLPFISKPAELNGYYKYNAVGFDSCFFDIAITKFNTSSMKQDTIGHGKFSSGSVSSWTSFNVPVKYYLNEIPDSMNIVILSSDTSIFNAGSTLWVDDLLLKY